MRIFSKVWLIAIIPVAALVILLAVDTPVAPPGRPDDVELSGLTGGGVGDYAPDFTMNDNWFNSDPLTIGELQGKVVLIDFWTYTCINCIRTLPYLRDWHEKYADRGLVIVGVHSPEFEFERIPENVVRAADEFELRYPIAQDNSFGTWRAYNNRFWPAKYLIDQGGVVRYTHFGEGAYDETEQIIRDLLAEGGLDVSSIGANDDPGPSFDTRAVGVDPRGEDSITRELYGGWSRNATPNGIYVAHVEYYDGPQRTLDYTDPGDHLNQFLYLQGPWFNGLESVKHGRATENFEDYIALRLRARSANAVIDLAEGVEPFRVMVTIDDPVTGEERPLAEEEAGEDIVFDAGGTFLNVDESRVYFVLSLPEFDERELKFSSNSPEFALFAMTFGAYAEIP